MGKFRAFFQRRKLQQQLDDEVRLHIELQAEEYRTRGHSPEDALAAARKRFGNAASVQEDCRDANGLAWTEAFRLDLSFGARTLLRQPGFTATVLVTLMLGIGANTAMFSVLRGILLEPLALPQPDRVVAVWEFDRLRGTARESASFPDYLDIKQQSTVFEHIAAIERTDVTLVGAGEAERVRASRVTASYFPVLGVQPLAGRAFQSGEDGIVLSHALWQRKFNGDKGALGRMILVDGVSVNVLGVMPAGAVTNNPLTELWWSMEKVPSLQPRGRHSTSVLGRLRPGVSLDQAQTELTSIMARLEKDHPDDNLGRGARAVELHEDLSGSMKPALRVLTFAVFAVLVIACVNIASLLLARASARSGEMAVRSSLGAGRSRLTRQLLTESLLLAVIGGLLGAIAAYWGVQGLVAITPPGIPLVGRVRVDLIALAATAGLSVLAWAMFGIVPAWRATRATEPELHAASRRNTAGRESHRLLHVLVMAEIALAMVLVISAGLLIRSSWRMSRVDVGYDPAGVMSLSVKLPESRYPWPKFPFKEWPSVIGFHSRLKKSVMEIPGIQAASLAMASPSRETWTTRVFPDGRPAPPEGEQKEAQFRTADADYLKVTKARLLRGRFFEESDDERHPMVAVVNESFVREHFPGEEPMGRRINVFGSLREIVGVLGDIRYEGPGAASSPTMYFPQRQQPFPEFTLIVRGVPDALAGLAPALRRAVSSTDPAVAAFDVMTLETALELASIRERFVLRLLTGFGSLAFLLAVIGIYGVVSYVAAKRRREIAVRIAMGATKAGIFREVTGAMVLRAAVGAAVGLALATVAAPLMQPLVFNTSTRDVATYAAVAAMFLTVAFLGAALPARRAAGMDPVVALREE